MDPLQFAGELNALLRAEVSGLSSEEKAGLVQKQLALWRGDETLLHHRVSFVPFVPGRRPKDEALSPGLGSSDGICVLGSGDRMVFLYRLGHAGFRIDELPRGARLVAKLELLDHVGDVRLVVPGWESRELSPERLQGSQRGSAFASTLDVDADLLPLAGTDANDPFGFASIYFERFRLTLGLEVGDAFVAGDALTFEAFDTRRFGRLYERISTNLAPGDLSRQCAGRRVRELPVAYHPWFPVLCIGVEKANLYMQAVHGDVVGQKRMLTDPAWLLRVGLYLELLTCLGVFDAVRREAGDLLSPGERRALEVAPRLEAVRTRLAPAAWRRVWEKRTIAFGTGLGDMPVGFANLLRKKDATLGFLHAHHEDLANAIELAGANRVNAQETWHRVFRDAERAVLKMSDEAFPELSYLPPSVKELVLWHRKGTIGPLRLVPEAIGGAFGDQDGIYPSACRQYRDSMNAIAKRALAKGLMEYTGRVCIPEEVSILESTLANDEARVRRLQHRDGYEGGLVVRERDEEERRLGAEDISAMLARIRLFRAFSDDELHELGRRARPIRLGPHERILVQGNPGSSIFVLHDGELEVVRERKDGRESAPQILSPGAIVGEISFLTGQPRSATVRATDGALVVELAASDLRVVVRGRPELLEALTEEMVRRLERDRRDKGRASLRKKIAAFLLKEL
jgi:hypothetical protein